MIYRVFVYRTQSHPDNSLLSSVSLEVIRDGLVRPGLTYLPRLDFIPQVVTNT